MSDTKKRTAPAWSGEWLRAQPWRDIKKMNAHFIANPPTESLVKSRARRVFEELQRRRKEGGGGWAANEEHADDR